MNDADHANKDGPGTPAAPTPRVIALIVAAGKGVRAGGGLAKQYRPLAGRALICHALDAFLSHPRVSAVRTVIAAGDEALYREAIGARADRMDAPIPGGDSRQASVHRGLAALDAADARPDIVLIHDAARPFVPATVIDAVIDAVQAHGAAIPAHAVTDSLKRAAPDGAWIARSVPRGDLFHAQTPQGFDFGAILDAHLAAAEAGLEATDDAALVEAQGRPVMLVPGDPEGLKVTDTQDFARAERRLAADTSALGANALETRVGQGFDVHRFEEGDHVMLCGVRIDHDRGLKGHSDADVGLHALCDAILGALALGDIGQHFPPDDARWRDADSADFLRHVLALAADRGARVRHLDVTLICERPKIGPHRDAMRVRIAEITGLSLDRVSVKATTTEGLGFAGRKEGIAAQAVASLTVPADD